METEKMRKMPKQLYCEKCDFKCYKRSNFDIHLGTAKHRRKHLETIKTAIKIYCECGKEYSNRSGLFKHKKKCTYKTQEELLAETMKQQKEEQLKLLQEQIKEQSMWRTLYPSIKKDNGVGHCVRKRSLSI
jgi:hypothetical protein